jgi:hypothetical protein
MALRDTYISRAVNSGPLFEGSLSYPANRFPFGNNRGIQGTAGASGLVFAQCPHGQFEVYNIANNQITGAALFSQVELDWQTRRWLRPRFAKRIAIVAQLVQAMAGFGGSRGAAYGLNAAPCRYLHIAVDVVGP